MQKLVFITLILSLISTDWLLGQSSERLLNEAIYKEEVSGEIEEAIQIYKTLLTSDDASRKTKAQALLHLGLSHEKLGNQSAGKYYRMLIDQYSDQKDLLSTARSRLNYINKASQPGMLEKKFQSTVKVYSRPDIYGTISNDGSKVSFVSWEKGNLALYDVASGKAIDITNDGSWGPNVGYSDMSVWSSDDTQLAYLWLTDNAGELRIYDAKTKQNSTVLPKTEDKFPYPIAWTTDNRILINYGSFDRLTWSYHLFDPTSGHLEHIHTINTNEMSALDAVSISPDGKYMAYLFVDNDKNYCHIYRSGQFNEKPLSVIENIADKPFWSPGMNKIYYTRSKFSNKLLLEATFEKGVVGESENIILENLPEEIAQMVMDPNGTSIHYVSVFNQYTIYKTKLDWVKRAFKKSDVIVDAAYGISGPSWSPDGKAFVYVKSKGDNWVGCKIVLRNLNTGMEKEYDLGIKILEVNYFLSNIHWSPTGKHLLVTFNIYDEKDVEHQRMALLDLESGEYIKFDQDIIRPAITLLSDKDIYYFEKGRGIVHYDIIQQTKDLIYSVESPNELIAYLKRNESLDQMVFYRSQSFEVGEIGELVLLNLNNKTYKSLATLSESESFMMGESPQWVNEDKEIFVPIRDLEKDTYQFYTIDIDNLTREPFGESMKAELKHRWLHPNINGGGSEMLYLKRINSAAAWSIHNL